MADGAVGHAVEHARKMETSECALPIAKAIILGFHAGFACVAIWPELEGQETVADVWGVERARIASAEDDVTSRDVVGPVFRGGFALAGRWRRRWRRAFRAPFTLVAIGTGAALRARVAKALTGLATIAYRTREGVTTRVMVTSAPFGS